MGHLAREVNEPEKQSTCVHSSCLCYLGWRGESRIGRVSIVYLIKSLHISEEAAAVFPSDKLSSKHGVPLFALFRNFVKLNLG